MPCARKLEGRLAAVGGLPPGSWLDGSSAWALTAKVVTLSEFSIVDASGDIGRLVSCLESTDTGLGPMKAYMAAALKRKLGDGLVVDVGCGIGLDLHRLHAAGLRPIGLDPSRQLLARVRQQPNLAVPLVRAEAERLPFPDASIDGCRAERVLLHVDSPATLIQEMARVLRPGGVMAVFEPDWGTLEVESWTTFREPVLRGLVKVLHPDVGGQVAALAAMSGLQVDDIVIESSRAYRLEDVPFDLVSLVRQQVGEGQIDAGVANAWVAEQQQRSESSNFKASWDKVLVLAQRC